MLKVLIIDDENNAVKTLQSYIHKYTEGVTVAGIAHSKQEAIDLISSAQFDVLLLDINLGDGTGFDVLEATSGKEFSVIFTTAYDEHAIKAFKYSALDYLLKPINPQEFVEAIERCKIQNHKSRKPQLNYASQLAKSGVSDKILVNSSNEIHFLEISEIVHLQSDGNYTDIFPSNQAKITSTKTLKFYEQLLEEYSFFRIHQKHLVNTKFITKFLKDGGGHVLLSNGTKLEVSRRKKEDLLNQLLKKQ
jgi:two-component system LytT family response regulator